MIREEKGFPCLKCLELWKNFIREPFTVTYFLHLKYHNPKIIFSMSDRRKFQFKWLGFFYIQLAYYKPSLELLFLKYTVSLVIRAACKIGLPFTNAFWCSETDLNNHLFQPIHQHGICTFMNLYFFLFATFV